MEQVKGKGSAVIQFIYSFSTKTISLSIDNMEISTKEIRVSIYLSVFVWTSRPVKKTRPQEQKRSGNKILPCRQRSFIMINIISSSPTWNPRLPSWGTWEVWCRAWSPWWGHLAAPCFPPPPPRLPSWWCGTPSGWGCLSCNQVNSGPDAERCYIALRVK